MRIIKSLMSVLFGCLMVLVCSNSVLAVECPKYFGKPQCKLKTAALTGGSCQLNSALGTINIANLSDRINDWKWSYSGCSGSVTPTSVPTATVTRIPTPAATSGCQGKYFGQSQCKLKTPSTGGACQLNPDLGVINTVNPSDRINDWRWSWCGYGPSCIPASDNVSGCTYVKQNYSTQCTRDYYQDTHQQCSPIVSGSSMINHYSCSCFYESLQYNCGGVSKFLYLPQIGGNGKYAAFSYYNYKPTCTKSTLVGGNGPWMFTTASQCAAMCAGK